MEPPTPPPPDRLPTGLLSRLSPNCHEMSQLTSHSLDAEPDWAARFGMAVHRKICPNCRRYDQQLRWMHAAARQLADHAPTNPRPVPPGPSTPPDDLRP